MTVTGCSLENARSESFFWGKAKSGVLRLTRAGDYAVRAVLHLATQPEESIIDRDTVSQAEDIPTSFLSKILQQLSAAGIVRSFKGSSGGFSLARPAAEISFLEVIKAVEGPLALNKCLLGNGACDRTPTCPVHPIWKEAQDSLESALGSVNFGGLCANWLKMQGNAGGGSDKPV